MPEAEAPRHLAGTDEIAGCQLVDRIERVGFLHACRRDGQIEFERVAGDRRGLGEPASAAREPIEFGDDRRDDRWRDLRAATRAMNASGSATGELQHVERIAAARAIELLQLCRARGVHQLVCGDLRQRAQLDTADRVALGSGSHDGRRESPIDLTGAKRRRDQDRCLRRAAKEVGNELDRGAVGPVEVLQHQDHRLGPGEPLDQVAQGMVCAKALGRGGRPGRPRRERAKRGEHARYLREILRGKPAERARLERAEVFVQSVDHEPERQFLLELGCAAAQRETAATLGAPDQLIEQRGLPDAGLPGDEHDSRGARDRLLEQLLGEVLLVLSAHDGRCGRRHGVPDMPAYKIRVLP